MKYKFLLGLVFLFVNTSNAFDPIQGSFLRFLEPKEKPHISAEAEAEIDPRCEIVWNEPHEPNECDVHMGLYIQRLQNPAGLIGSWAFKMFDSSGKINDGLLGGHFDFMGNMHECIDVHVLAPGNSTGPFWGKYVVVEFGKGTVDEETEKLEKMFRMVNPGLRMPIFLPNYFQSAISVFQGAQSSPKIALCVPDSCPEYQIRRSLEKNICSSSKGTIYGGILAHPPVTKERNYVMETKDKVMLSFFGFLIIFLVAGTILDTWQNYRTNQHGIKYQNGNLEKFLLGFSVYTNGRKMLNTTIPKGADHLGCIDGIRFLSMSWVVLCHCFGESFTGIPLWEATYGVQKTAGDSILINAILNGFPSVDSFFLISGVLLTYLTLKELEKTRGRISIPLFYIHRYLRLTGTYLIIIGFHATVLKYLCFGPKCKPLVDAGKGCQKGWWANLLYINNFGSGNGENFSDCIGQTWYLANDMQMFLITPLIIWPLFFKPVIGLLWTGALTVASIIIPTVLTAVHHWPASVLLESSKATEGDDVNYFEWNYVKPWCRFSPYVIGILVGYILHVTKKKPLKLNPMVVTWFWAAAFATGLAVIYGLNIHVTMEPLSDELTAFYGGFHRAAWALALGWLIIACCRGYGGWINSFLCWGGFIPLSRISYIIYLMHFDVIWFIESNYQSYQPGTNTFMTIFFLSVLTYTAIVSAIIYVCIEMPWLSSEKLLFATILAGNRNPRKPQQSEHVKK